MSSSSAMRRCCIMSSSDTTVMSTSGKAAESSCHFRVRKLIQPAQRKRIRAINTVIKQHRHHQRKMLMPIQMLLHCRHHTASAETPYAHPACSDVQSRHRYNRRPRAFSATKHIGIIGSQIFSIKLPGSSFSVRRSQSWRNLPADESP